MSILLIGISQNYLLRIIGSEASLEKLVPNLPIGKLCNLYSLDRRGIITKNIDIINDERSKIRTVFSDYCGDVYNRFILAVKDEEIKLMNIDDAVMLELENFHLPDCRRVFANNGARIAISNDKIMRIKIVTYNDIDNQFLLPWIPDNVIIHFQKPLILHGGNVYLLPSLIKGSEMRTIESPTPLFTSVKEIVSVNNDYIIVFNDGTFSSPSFDCGAINEVTGNARKIVHVGVLNIAIATLERRLFIVELSETPSIIPIEVEGIDDIALVEKLYSN